MNIGILFDEGKIEKDLYENYIYSSLKHGVSNIEIAPHEKLMDLCDYKFIVKLADENKVNSSYHVPDFVSPFEFEISNFKEDNKVKNNFYNFFEYLYTLKNDNKQIITFHGPKNNNGSSIYSPKDNLNYFLEWALSYFVKADLDTILAIENMANIEENRFSQNPDELLKLLTEFNSKNLSLCYDVAHDYRRQSGEIILPSDEYIKKISIAHIHGYDKITKVSHLPLVNTNIDYSHALSKINKLNSNITINIELLDKDYAKLIFNDVEKLKEQL
jgi:hypothetical protein